MLRKPALRKPNFVPQWVHVLPKNLRDRVSWQYSPQSAQMQKHFQVVRISQEDKRLTCSSAHTECKYRIGFSDSILKNICNQSHRPRWTYKRPSQNKDRPVITASSILHLVLWKSSHISDCQGQHLPIHLLRTKNTSLFSIILYYYGTGYQKVYGNNKNSDYLLLNTLEITHFPS